MAAGLQVEVVDGIATVTIDSPPINLFTFELFMGMAQLAGELAVDDAVRVVVLRSADPEFFIAHFDVGLILRFPADPSVPC